MERMNPDKIKTGTNQNELLHQLTINYSLLKLSIV